MSSKIHINYSFSIVVLIILNNIFTSCQKDNNDDIIKKFNKEFINSINKFNAKKFEYLYDGLVPQESYFIKSKLKFLKYIHGPENGTIESLVFFDKSDSIEKIIRRKIFYQWDDNKNEYSENFTDTIFLINYKNKKMFTYVNNKITDSIFNKSVFESDLKFINSIKMQTEIAYNK